MKPDNNPDATSPAPTPDALPTQREQARALVAMSRQATLATLDAQTGHPYASLVQHITTEGGDPIFLLSSLAVHTRNLRADPRASLMCAEPWPSDEPLERPRVTLVGALREVEEAAARDSAREAFLAAHPGAQGYVHFKDFSFYRLHVERARYIAGFGRMSWMDVADWSTGAPELMWSVARGVIEHMNDDHAHNLIDYARAFTDASWTTSARMVGIDRLGLELVARGDDGQREALRIPFPAPLTTTREARAMLVHLAHTARAALAETSAEEE